MKSQQFLSLAFGAVLGLSLAPSAFAQDASAAASPALTMERVAVQPTGGNAAESLDDRPVDARTQNEVKSFLDRYSAAQTDDQKALVRGEGIRRLETLLADHGNNLSLRSLLSFFYIQAGQASQAVALLESIDGRSRIEATNRANLQNLALAYYLTRDWSSAAAAYDRLAGSGPLDVPAARFAGSAHLLAGSSAQAIPYLETVRGSVQGAELKSVLKDLGLAYIRADRTQEALAVYERLTADGDAEPEVLSWMGYGYLRARSFGQAIEVLERARKASPRDQAVLNNLANAYTGRDEAGDKDKAVALYQELGRLVPASPTPSYNIGVLRMMDGRYEEAVTAYRNAVRLGAGNPASTRFALNNLGFCLEKLGRHAESAEAYAQASDLEPGNGTFARNAGLAFTRASQAAASADDRSRLSSRAAVYLKRAKDAGMEIAGSDAGNAQALVEAGRLDEAKKMLEQAVEVNPNDPNLWFNLGVVNGRLEDRAGAEKAYREVLRIRPDDGDALKNLGIVLIDSGRTAEAIETLQKMVGAYPASLDGRMALASAYLKADRLAEAVEEWRGVVRRDPSRVDARLSLADGLWNLGMARDARFHYATVLQTQAGNARALNGMGLWHLLQSDATQAERNFRRAVESDPGYLPAYNNLAVALERLNRKPEAILILRKALDRDPNFEQARTNLERLQSPANMQS
ncbi:MAG: tetratricopeptide repeat protein [Fimbriimonadaceae bacterium]|nr:tetratricopeptide repeat protein [Fimbriimonadaceae bacterium]